MQFIKPDININFIQNRKIAFVLSAVMIGLTFISLIMHQGLNFGIDFAGGTVIQIKFDGPTKIETVKAGLRNLEIDISSVQEFGDSADHEFLIRADSSTSISEDVSQKIKSVLKTATNNDVEIRRVEMVGPQVGKDLRKKAQLAMFFALLFITIYISGRFESKKENPWLLSGFMAGSLMFAVYILTLFNVSIPFLMLGALLVTLVLFWILNLRYAMGAVVALMHDVTITVGLFSLFDKEFTLPIIAALLTIIGYSLNDTIIVFDRIRENLRKYHKKRLEFILNKSINETLGRTILTSLTTLIVLVTLFIFGGGIIHDFAFALIVGVLVGTYSSIFVASPILMAWQKRQRLQ